MIALAALRSEIESKVCPCCGRQYDFNKVTVSLDFNSISYRRRNIPLPPILCEVAYVLAGQMPNVARRDFVIEKVWGGQSEADRQTIDVHISRLRRLITPLGISIETIKTVGWRMKAA